MHVFQRIEAFVALELVDLVTMINIELVFSEKSNGERFGKGENERFLRHFDCDAITVEGDLGVLIKHFLLFIRNHVCDRGFLGVKRRFRILQKI